MARCVALAAVLLALSCDGPTTPPGPDPLESLGNPIVAAYPQLVVDSLWQTSSTAIDLTSYLQDPFGVPIFAWEGRTFYHPVDLAQYGMEFLNGYRLTGDSVYLGHARATGERLLAQADELGGALLFPYEFSFALHNIASETMTATWYSGMAQGQAMAFLVRLHQATLEESWLDAAARVLPSFTMLLGTDSPYIAHVDENGYYWIDQYPLEDRPTLALNGTIFALYGLYEYWQETGDAFARAVIDATLATMRDNMGTFRNPGERSFYCLAHHVKSATYHEIHIRQARDLARMTGDPYFSDLADSLRADWP